MRARRELDRSEAAAETQLDRVDDDAVDEVTPTREDAGSFQPDDYGVHVDDPDSDLLDDDLDVGLRDDAEADALDAIAEAFNARDLDGLVAIVAADGEAPGLLGYDRNNLAAAIEDLWQRRPSCNLTRGRAEREYVGVLWEHDGTAWWRLAAVHVDDVDDGLVGVLEFSDDPALLDAVECEPPHPHELDEGTRWQEWDEGADGDDEA